MRHQGAMRRLDLLCLCLCPWGFGHPMSGSPELSWPQGWRCLFIQASPAHAAGSLADPTACKERPMPLCGDRMAHHFSLCPLPPQRIPAGPS